MYIYYPDSSQTRCTADIVRSTERISDYSRLRKFLNSRTPGAKLGPESRRASERRRQKKPIPNDKYYMRCHRRHARDSRSLGPAYQLTSRAYSSSGSEISRSCPSAFGPFHVLPLLERLTRIKSRERRGIRVLRELRWSSRWRPWRQRLGSRSRCSASCFASCPRSRQASCGGSSPEPYGSISTPASPGRPSPTSPSVSPPIFTSSSPWRSDTPPCSCAAATVGSSPSLRDSVTL